MSNTSTSETQPTDAEQLRQQVRRLARAVPRGRVISYGELGVQCEPPISGYVCGRVMGQLMDDVPWWRVVAKNGQLAIGKRGPEHALKQRALLESEGVTFEGDAVEMRFFAGETRARAPQQGELFERQL